MTTTPDFVTGFDLKEPATTTTRVAKPKSDDAITLRGVRVPLNSDVGGAFVSDCCRNKERIFSDDRIREKYDISETDESRKAKQSASLSTPSMSDGC